MRKNLWLRVVLLFFLFNAFFIRAGWAQFRSETSENYHRDYWPGGQLRSEEPLVNGKKEGLANYYYENGQRYAVIPWVNGQKHGQFTLYRENGAVEQELSYAYGKLDGLCRWYYPDGTMQTEVSYKDDKMDGPSRWFDAQGIQTDEAYYENGQMVQSRNPTPSMPAPRSEELWRTSGQLPEIHPIVWAVIAQVLLLAIIFFYIFKRSQRFVGVLEEQARKRNGTIRKNFLGGELHLKYLDCDYRVFLFSRGSGKRKHSYTGLECRLNMPDDFRLHIYGESIVTRIGKSFGMQDIIINNPSFDAAFVISTNNELLAREIFQQRLQYALLELKGQYVKFSVDNRIVLLDVPGYVSQIEVLDKMIHCFEQILGRFKELE